MNLRSRVGDFWRDHRGAVTAQAILVLPVFLLVVFGGITLWKVLTVKQTLHAGTYQAARYLSLYPIDPRRQETWERIAREIIETELADNPLVPNTTLESLIVTFAGDPTGDICGLRFTIEATYRFRIGVPDLVPFVRLTDRHEGRIECG